MHWFTYIIKGKDGRFYKGLTNNLEKRLYQHTLGQSNTTRHFKDMRLVHVEVCNSRQEARKLENFFKSGFGREILKELF